MAEEFLRVTAGAASGAEVPLGQELRIGRTAGGEGSMGGDSELSREHALIRRGGAGELTIQDLGSTNGTYVNGELISAPTALRPGDTISLGSTVMRLEAPATPGVQATAVGGQGAIPPVQATRVAPPGAGEPPPAAPPPGVGGPPPGGPPAGGPPPGIGPPPGGPPPGVGGPPPGVGGPPGGGGMPPAMGARIRRMAILAGAGGFVLGGAVASALWNFL